jgi:hypothetical protein
MLGVFKKGRCPSKTGEITGIRRSRDLFHSRFAFRAFDVPVLMDRLDP